jgi:multidrug efflux pump subunit AcrA (membrane-fusion protein)
MEMRASAPVAAGASIAAGQVVELRVDGLGGRTVEGVVDRIAPVAEEGTRTLTVFVAVGNDDGRLLGGMFATGEIVLAEARDALACRGPRSATKKVTMCS